MPLSTSGVERTAFFVVVAGVAVAVSDFFILTRTVILSIAVAVGFGVVVVLRGVGRVEAVEEGVTATRVVAVDATLFTAIPAVIACAGREAGGGT